MTDAALLDMVKANLQIPTAMTRFDSFITFCVNVARQEIAREGITLEDDFSDNNLIVMYASYLYRERETTDTENRYNTAAFGASGMPRMLRYALNQRLMQQAASSEDSES